MTAVKQRSIELLAPAKDLQCGMEAVLHGADAVYIGAPRFGARAAAGNSVDDIARLAGFAHVYNARVYVALNTILYDDELEEARCLAWRLWRAGADALIVQDMALLRMHLPPIPLHASTQMDNRTAEKVRFLADAGFSQAVLARELSLAQIREIHEACPGMPLEVFVHGALCVSYSGQCYASQACFGRSANRGECAQFCRLPFDLEDADGKKLVRGKHLLSLRDLNQSDRLEQLLDAGATSLKIEGRLKDVAYVKNVTAYYRRKLDELFARRTEYCRSSSGTCRYTFVPDAAKSFNRGFTHYFLLGRGEKVASVDSPKSLGEEAGRVKEVRRNCLAVAGIRSFANGDGLCFFDGKGVLRGFRVNRVEGNKLYPQEMPPLKPGTLLYRNYDQQFERLLSKPSSERKIRVDAALWETAWGFSLELRDEDACSVTLAFACRKEEARTPQAGVVREQLAKLGGTPFELCNAVLRLSGNWFIPSSLLSEWRRQAVAALLRVRRMNYRSHVREQRGNLLLYPRRALGYDGNVANRMARAFYESCGVASVSSAFEQTVPDGDVVLMTCKYCLRDEMGWCTRRGKQPSPLREPCYLVLGDGRRFRLKFDCQRCEMLVIKEGAR